jgi:hypothetical protein
VKLDWATASELHNDYFTVERSMDGLNWENIIQIAGAGTSTNRNDYSEVDTRPIEGLSYYRLKQTDFDGQFTYSHAVSVQYEARNNEIVKIVNLLGQEVDEKTSGVVIFIFSNGTCVKVIND